MKALPFVLLLLAGASLLPSAAAASPAEMGDFQLMDRPDRSCPEGATCQGFRVQCPGTGGVARGFLAIHDVAAARGMVVLHGGGPAARYWASTGDTWAALETLHANQLSTVQIRWVAGWTASDGVEAGPRLLACRPATVVHWVHENLYQSMAIDAAPGICGFCYTGNSAGAAAMAYALTFYGADEWLDAAVLTSGPPFSDIDGACLDDAGRRSVRLDATAAARIDEQYGRDYPGPCVRGDRDWEPRWRADSLDGAGGDWSHPTRMHLILGQDDDTGAVAHARHYTEVLVAHGTDVDVDLIPGMGHTVQHSPQGTAAVAASLIATN